MRKTTPLVRYLTVALWLGAPGFAASAGAAQALQSHASILETGRQFLEAQVTERAGRTEVEMGALDRRVRLPRCDGQLEGFLPPGGRLAGNTSVGVRCNGSKPWKLYVPARIRLFREVAVADGYLDRNTRIREGQVVMAERDVTAQNRGFITDPARVVGKTLKRTVYDGDVISPGVLDRPKLIQRGEQVTIVSRSRVFEVRMQGEALTDGSKGDRIKVKNKKSKRIVEGEVAAQGLIIVQL